MPDFSEKGAGRGLYQWLSRGNRAARDNLAYLSFFLRHRQLFGDVNADPASGRRVLFVSPSAHVLELNLSLVRALRARGFAVVVVDTPANRLRRFVRFAGATASIPLHEMASGATTHTGAAQAMIGSCRTFEELLECEWKGIRVGRIAASTALRKLNLGDVILDAAGRRLMLPKLAKTLSGADWARNVVDTLRPDIAIFMGTEYSPYGELFDACFTSGVDTIVREVSHRPDSLFLKRYSAENTGEHVTSLSAMTWHLARAMPWSERMAERLRSELTNGYQVRGWYSAVRTQSNTRLASESEVRESLGIDPSKPTAFVFAHIPFDAPFNWVKPLFRNYQQWLIETVRAATENDRVNWVVKIHPANAAKLGGRITEPVEVSVLRREFPALPPHVKILSDRTHISTLSLFGVMDYCLTVRGTIGIEAAARGIPVITAGESRYSGLGFTIDPASPAEYKQRLRDIRSIARLTPEQQQLAQRYAYALLLMRPFVFQSVTWDYDRPEKKPNSLYSLSGNINLKSTLEWKSAPDLAAFVDWIADSASEDYLSSVPGAAAGVDSSHRRLTLQGQ